MPYGFYMKVLMAAWNKGFCLCCKSRRKETKEIVMELRRNFRSYLPE